MTSIKILFYPNYYDIDNEIQYAVINNQITPDKIMKENDKIIGMICGIYEWYFIDLNNLYISIETLNILSSKYNIHKIFYYNKLNSYDQIYSKIFDYIVKKCKLSNLDIFTLSFLFDKNNEYLESSNEPKSSYFENFMSYIM